MRVENIGNNQMMLTFFKKDVNKKISDIRNYKGGMIKYFLYKDKNKKYGGSIPIRAIHVSAVYGYSKSTKYRYKKKTGLILPNYFYNSILSPASLPLTQSNIKEFIIEWIKEYYDKYENLIDTEYSEPIDVYNLIKITIRFIYRKK